MHKYVQKDFTDYSKLLVQINNNSKATPDYLFFTIHGTAVVSNPEGYIIVYGVKDWSDSVDPSVYDDAFYVQMFKYENGDMQMQTDIDLNNNKIKNIPPPTNPTDLLMKQSVHSYLIHLYGMVSNQKILTSNGVSIQFQYIKITAIEFFAGQKYIGANDQLTIIQRFTNPRRLTYPFRYSSRNGHVMVNINHQFHGVSLLQTQTAIQIKFILYYRPITI